MERSLAVEWCNTENDPANRRNQTVILTDEPSLTLLRSKRELPRLTKCDKEKPAPKRPVLTTDILLNMRAYAN